MKNHRDVLIHLNLYALFDQGLNITFYIEDKYQNQTDLQIRHLSAQGSLFILINTIFYSITVELQWSNTDGSFTTAVSNSFLSPFEKVP